MITTQSPRRGPFVVLAVIVGCVTGLALLAGSAYLLFYGSEGSCQESKAVERMARVSAAAPAVPAGAMPVTDRTYVECMDDSGDPWVMANSAYSHDMDAKSLVAHYWDTASKEGWKAVGTREQAPAQFRSGSGMCFHKEVDGAPALLRVGADGPTEFAVTMESALDGSTITC
ncbi:hypothetical protein ACFYYS_17890 [Streptomyces sp. NPDC002120]|uniref:hypothetical protein n=1 Tax=Streptomyces sp. NPDC002120 TaxID=3364631 RepID=UPI0036B64C5C